MADLSPKGIIKQKISGLNYTMRELKKNKLRLSTRETDQLIDLKIKRMLLQQKLELM